jgi:hypothetical protein
VVAVDRPSADKRKTEKFVLERFNLLKYLSYAHLRSSMSSIKSQIDSQLWKTIVDIKRAWESIRVSEFQDVSQTESWSLHVRAQ